MSDTKSKPNVGDIYTQGRKRFIVTKVKGNIIYLVEIDSEDKKISSEQSYMWPDDFSDFEKGNSKKGKSTGMNNTDSSKFSFSFDPETGEIIVTWPDGKKTERLQSIKGEKGDSVFEEWCRRTGRKPDANNWEAFLKSLRGADGFTVNGVDGLSPYEEWKSRQQEGSDTSYTAFLRSITGEKGKDGYEGRDGKDGLSAFEVWKSLQPNGENLTEKDFFEFLKGKPGANGHEGIDGQDGDTWIPYVNDGKLYFENARTKERTEVFDIRGLQGLDGNDGRDGDTWKPFFKNGEHGLYFRNQHGDEIGPFDVVGATGKTGEQGPRGESAYQIWLNEGNRGDFHDFLLWVAKHADKGADGEDGDTYIPHVEKGVLFFISEKTGRKIHGGNVVGPTGAKGDMGLPGHNIEHEYDYHDLKDFTCPVQEIPERLISESDNLNAYGSAEEHMRQTLNEINNIRERGKQIKDSKECNWLQRILYKIHRPKKNGGSLIQEIFWWCSGADRPLLRMCPAEHSKYMGIGTVIFFTALMAMFSSYVAISYVFGGIDAQTGEMKWSWLAGVFAIFWGLMIFFLDRFITNTMYSDGKVTISWLELRSALPRILISIFLGIVISAPLELKIFKHEIDEYLYNQALSSIDNKYNAELDSCQVSIKAYTDSIQSIVSQKPKIDELKKQQEKLEKELKIKYNQTKSKYSNSRPRSQGKNETDEDYRKYLNGVENQNKSSALQVQTALSIELHGDSIKLQNLSDRITELSIGDSIFREDRNIVMHYSDSLKKLKNETIGKININRAGLYDRLSALHKIAYQEDKDDGYKPLPAKIVIPLIDRGISTKFMCGLLVFVLLAVFTWSFMPNVTKNDSTETISRKELRKKGILVTWPWFAVVAIIAGLCCDSLFNALPYFIFSAVGLIMMLFILIDVSPVFYKMMLADGQYEQILHKEKSVTQDLIRLNFAQSVVQVNNSQVGKLTSMIFSKPWAKIQEILSKTKDDNKPELGYGESEYQEKINRDNKALFDEILDMKTAIIRAAYMAWYRDMRDSILGIHKKPSDDQSENASDESSVGGTSPKYERDSNDPHSGTPEDIFSDFEQRNGMGNEQSDAGNNEFEEDAEENNTAFDSDSDNDEDRSYSEDDSEEATDHSSDNDSSTDGEEDSNYDSDTDVDSDSETNNNHAEETDSNPDSEWEQVIDDDEEEVDSDKNKN